MASTMRIVSTVCTFLLIFTFGMAGVVKLTPIVSPEIHGEIVSDMVLLVMNSACLFACLLHLL